MSKQIKVTRCPFCYHVGPDESFDYYIPGWTDGDADLQEEAMCPKCACSFDSNFRGKAAMFFQNYMVYSDLHEHFMTTNDEDVAEAAARRLAAEQPSRKFVVFHALRAYKAKVEVVEER